MNLGKVAAVFADRWMFTTTGLRSAGRRLVRALGSSDETVRTLAGMFLVQAGRKSEPLLEEAAQRRFQLPLVLDVLGSLEDPATVPIFERYAQDPDPETRDAAREALRLFHHLEQQKTAHPAETPSGR